jgi:hypothetical protein
MYFQNKNPNLGKIWRNLKWKMLVYFMGMWSLLQPFGVFYGHLVYFMAIWYMFSRFGMLSKETSGNPSASAATVVKKCFDTCCRRLAV